MLKLEDALRVETVEYGEVIRRGKRRTYKVYFYTCAQCGNEVRSQITHLKKHSGKCVRCGQFSDPFRAAFNELTRGCERKGREITLTYEDFVCFTKITHCHYCNSGITWHPHTKHAGKDISGSRAYKLDRMNNSLGYLKSNCVVCCRKCNEGKGARYTYDEWYGMTAYLRNKTAV